MSTEQNEAKDVINKIHDKQEKDFWKWAANTPVVLVVKGIWLFAEGTSLIVTSLYAIRQGHYASLPEWGGMALTIAGVLVLVPAALLLSKFFRGVAKA